MHHEVCRANDHRQRFDIITAKETTRPVSGPAFDADTRDSDAVEVGVVIVAGQVLMKIVSSDGVRAQHALRSHETLKATTAPKGAESSEDSQSVICFARAACHTARQS
jgi:hypothetical protein